MKAPAILLLCLSAFTQTGAQTSPPDQSGTRGRLATQQPIPYKLQDYSGILVDASCDDRSSLNLRQPPTAPDVAPPPNPRAPIAADPRSRGEANRAGVTAHQTPDVLSRQPDPSCAVTGSTREFALFLPNGRLLNLDEGGTTLAFGALRSLPEGRAMLAGEGPGLKPRVTLRGRVNGDRLIVDMIVKP